MIRNPTPRGIALITSLILAVLVAGFSYFFELQWRGILSLFIITLVLSFTFFYYALEVFIYRKIKLIYKTIHRLKTEKHKRSVLKLNEWSDTDPLGEVNKEVLSWAREQRLEIEQLKKLETFRKEFLGNVSHELKTPIFNIQGYIHTLIDGAIDDPDVNRRFLNKAARSLDRIVDLLEDLISISQLETGQLTMEKERFDIHALAKDVFESLEMRARERKISLAFKEGCDQPFFVFADRQRIRQVLANLVVNSINYGKEGGRTLVSFYDMHENLLVEVSDNGEGIEEKHLPRLFERFYRVDKDRSRATGGNGLGLSIVKHILEAHNQTINVRSKIGNGTTFGFTLSQVKVDKNIPETVG